MSQLELYFHIVTLARALAAQLFFGLEETLAAQDFRVVARALAAQLLQLALPTSV